MIARADYGSYTVTNVKHLIGLPSGRFRSRSPFETDLEPVSRIELDFIIREGEAPAEQN
jgi:hypothetical protein